MKNIEIIQLGETIKSNYESLKKYEGVKYSYCLSKNIEKLNKEINSIYSTVNPDEEYLVYDKERVQLCEKHADKNEDGSLVQIKNEDGLIEYKIDTTTVEWDSEITNLKSKYIDVIKNREQQIITYNNLLENESPLELYQISLDDLPTNINLECMDIIKPFIIE